MPAPLATLLNEPDEELADFLTSLLSIDPVLRPTAAEALKHPFLARADAVEPYELPQEARRSASTQPASRLADC